MSVTSVAVNVGTRVNWGWIKAAVFVTASLPFLWIAWRTLDNDLGANPVETLNRYTGDWTLRFMMIVLAMTPLRLITGRPEWLRFRRMFGLFAFFYASVHFLTWSLIDQQFVWSSILADIAKRPFITLGFTCLVLLVPLAVTSNAWSIRRLGAARWRWLHRLVYAIAVGGVVHYFWLVKSDIREPLLYAAILALLYAVRLWAWRRRRQAARASG